MTTTNSILPAFLNELLERCPKAGDGVNPWLYQVAKQLHVHTDPDEMFMLLQRKSKGCGRIVTDSEIRRQIECARVHAFQPKYPGAFAHGSEHLQDTPTSHRPLPAASPWPEPDFEAIEKIVAGGWGLYDLWESSPLRLEDGERRSEEIIDVLFPGNPLLCCGASKYKFANRRRETWRGHLERLAFITPNPMYRLKGLTVDGHLSEHAKTATAARVYMIIEPDISEFARDGKTPSKWAPLVRQWRAEGVSVLDAAAAIHRHLSARLPLVAAVHSGAKSIHGWYPAFNGTESQLRSFMEYAVSLGADRMLWNRAQFCRMPGGTREDGNAQTCYYINPGKAVSNVQPELR